MATLAEVVTGIVERILEKQARSSGVFEVVTTSPFTVYLDGGSTAYSALKVAGLTYSVGTKGRYVLDQGQLPVCIPTAT